MKKEKVKLDRENRLRKARHEWEELLPKWEIWFVALSSLSHSPCRRKTTPRLRKLIWQGAPPSAREKFWPLAVGNDLNITQGVCVCVCALTLSEELFAILGEKSRKAKKAARKMRQKQEEDYKIGRAHV